MGTIRTLNSAVAMDDDTVVPVSFVLMSAAKQIGERCSAQNYSYTACKRNNAHPDHCRSEGAAVHDCVNDVIRDSHQRCRDPFMSFCECMARNHSEFEKCRAEQLAFETCASKK